MSDQKLCKEPDSICGQQFSISDWNSCQIFIKDSNAGGFIDDCNDWQIMWGPGSNSVFVRDCQNCTFIIIWQQLRIRDCKNCEIMLYSQTEPVLESSSDIKYYCINYSYPELSDQMIESGLSIWNNQWYKQFDFTPNKKQSNFELIQGYGSKILSKFDMTDSIKTKERKDEVDVSDIVFGAEDEKLPTIPVTMGESLKLAENNILLLFKHSEYLQILKFYQM